MSLDCRRELRLFNKWTDGGTIGVAEGKERKKRLPEEQQETPKTEHPGSSMNSEQDNPKVTESLIIKPRHSQIVKSLGNSKT